MVFVKIVKLKLLEALSKEGKMGDKAYCTEAKFECSC